MYPALHYFEILLRNNINQLICEQFDNNWTLEIPVKIRLSLQDKAKINEIKLQVLREKGRKATHADIVSRLSFGFWCALFHKRLDPVIWHRKHAIRAIFPNLKREYQTRKYIERRILRIKNIRNRIAHHERIWDDSGDKYQLYAAYKDCRDLIFAMSRESIVLLDQVDRFPKIFKQVTSTVV